MFSTEMRKLLLTSKLDNLSKMQNPFSTLKKTLMVVNYFAEIISKFHAYHQIRSNEVVQEHSFQNETLKNDFFLANLN